MKNTILLTLFCCVASLQIFAQNETYRSVGSASVGYSLTSTLLKIFENEYDAGTISVKSIPALQLTYDYGVNNFFSIGVATGYQKFNVDATDFSYTNDEGIQNVEDFTAEFSRLNIAIRPLFHYANNDYLDLYSGFRVGIVNNNFNSDITDIDLRGFNNLTRFSFGLTAFGLRYYFTENIGAGFEVNLGAPYISALNINARF